MKKQSIYIVDAFTDHAFSGNQAAVCVYKKPQKFSDEQMQRVAAEMNLSETCFVFPIDEKEGLFSLRWFTPTTEVPLCGHGTLATAHVIFQRQKSAHRSQRKHKVLRFKTLKGELVVQKSATKKGHLEMDFPAGSPFAVGGLSKQLDESLSRALHLAAGSILDARMCNVTRKLLLVVSSPQVIYDAKPDAASLMAIEFPEAWTVKGVIVTAKSEPGRQYDFVSRYFAPFLGILEDPVTGSAHCALAPYWCGQLNRLQLTGFQVGETL